MSLPGPDRLSTIGPDDPVNITAEPAAVTTSRDKATAPFRWRAPHRAAPWHRYPHLCARSARFPTGLDLPAWIAPEMQRPGPPLPLLVRGILALYKKRGIIDMTKHVSKPSATGREPQSPSTHLLETDAQVCVEALVRCLDSIRGHVLALEPDWECDKDRANQWSRWQHQHWRILECLSRQNPLLTDELLPLLREPFSREGIALGILHWLLGRFDPAYKVSFGIKGYNPSWD